MACCYCSGLPAQSSQLTYKSLEWFIQGHTSKQQSQCFPISALLPYPLYDITSTLLETSNELNMKPPLTLAYLWNVFLNTVFHDIKLKGTVIVHLSSFTLLHWLLRVRKPHSFCDSNPCYSFPFGWNKLKLNKVYLLGRSSSPNQVIPWVRWMPNGQRGSHQPLIFFCGIFYPKTWIIA